MTTKQCNTLGIAQLKSFGTLTRRTQCFVHDYFKPFFINLINLVKYGHCTLNIFTDLLAWDRLFCYLSKKS